MSYCRWSSMNWRCDVYVYEDVGGSWTTHVASRRRVIPPIPNWPRALAPNLGGEWDAEKRKVVYPTVWRGIVAKIVFSFVAWWHRRVHMASLHLIPLREIGLIHDGKSFGDETPGECADRLEALRELGYLVPQYAIDELRAEQRGIA